MSRTEASKCLHVAANRLIAAAEGDRVELSRLALRILSPEPTVQRRPHLDPHFTIAYDRRSLRFYGLRPTFEAACPVAQSHLALRSNLGGAVHELIRARVKPCCERKREARRKQSPFRNTSSKGEV